MRIAEGMEAVDGAEPPRSRSAEQASARPPSAVGSARAHHAPRRARRSGRPTSTRSSRCRRATRSSTCSPSTGPGPPSSSRAGSAARCGAASTAATWSPACHVGANLVPVQATEDDARAFAERALTRSRTVLDDRRPARTRSRCSGTPSPTAWGRPARAAVAPAAPRRSTRPPLVEPDPAVRRTGRADLDELYPACVAMYTEEVGVSPELGGGADLYRARVTQLISRGLVVRALRRRAGWCSRPRSRARRRTPRRSRACTSPPTVAARGWPPPAWPPSSSWSRADIAPVVSLYVNGWNDGRPARLRAGRLPRDRRVLHGDVLTGVARWRSTTGTKLLAGIFTVSGVVHLVKPTVVRAADAGVGAARTAR